MRPPQVIRGVRPTVRGSQRRVNEHTAYPRLTPLVSRLLVGGLFVFFGFVLLHTWWWVAAVPFGYATLLVGLTVWAYSRREFQALTISLGQFAVYGRTFDRRAVASVSRQRDLRFDGVRVTLESGEAVAIPSVQHEPSGLLQTFRRHGYPVEDASGQEREGGRTRQ